MRDRRIDIVNSAKRLSREYYTTIATLLIAVLCSTVNATANVGYILKSPDRSKAYAIDGVSQHRDSLFLFGGDQQLSSGKLEITLEEDSNIKWEYRSPSSSSFTTIKEETNTTSSITSLGDGGYRVTFTVNGEEQLNYAYILNSWHNISAEITDSDCSYYILSGEVTNQNILTYYTEAGYSEELSREYIYYWSSENGSDISGSTLKVTDPTAYDVTYQLSVTDRTSGSTAEVDIEYISEVTESALDWSHDQELDGPLPEAPLDVTFINNSINGDHFEWFLYKDKDLLYSEGQNSTVVDSFIVVLNGDAPTYTYERSGTYDVKLVSSKLNDNGTICQDTAYLIQAIEIDTAYISVMEVFSPSGDGINDILIVKTTSIKELNFSIYNRWGRRVHHYKKSGFIPEDAELAAWDGKIGGRVATTGVYFYVATITGRDGTKKLKKGTIHLFR